MNEYIFVDIEASSLLNGYPIEIGWAWREANKIDGASVMIAPTEKWLTEYTWNPDAEILHGLSREKLKRFGDSPRHACGTLNLAFKDFDLVFDTGRNGADTTWIKMLFEEANMHPTFGILSASSETLVRNRAALLGISNDVYAYLHTLAPPMPHQAAVDAGHWVWWMIAIEKSADLHSKSLSLNNETEKHIREICEGISNLRSTRPSM